MKRCPYRQAARIPVVRASASAAAISGAPAAAPCHYEVLGVPLNASQEAIKQAYRRKVRELHPDVSKASDAQARFIECHCAYATLSDPHARAVYDDALTSLAFASMVGGGQDAVAAAAAAAGAAERASAPAPSFDQAVQYYCTVNGSEDELFCAEWGYVPDVGPRQYQQAPQQSSYKQAAAAEQQARRARAAWPGAAGSRPRTSSAASRVGGKSGEEELYTSLWHLLGEAKRCIRRVQIDIVRESRGRSRGGAAGARRQQEVTAVAAAAAPPPPSSAPRPAGGAGGAPQRTRPPSSLGGLGDSSDCGCEPWVYAQLAHVHARAPSKLRL